MHNYFTVTYFYFLKDVAYRDVLLESINTLQKEINLSKYDRVVQIPILSPEPNEFPENEPDLIVDSDEDVLEVPLLCSESNECMQREETEADCSSKDGSLEEVLAETNKQGTKNDDTKSR